MFFCQDTLSPFGRAFYQHDASYEVIPLLTFDTDI